MPDGNVSGTSTAIFFGSSLKNFGWPSVTCAADWSQSWIVLTEGSISSLTVIVIVFGDCASWLLGAGSDETHTACAWACPIPKENAPATIAASREATMMQRGRGSVLSKLETLDKPAERRKDRCNR